MFMDGGMSSGHNRLDFGRRTMRCLLSGHFYPLFFVFHYSELFVSFALSCFPCSAGVFGADSRRTKART